MAGQHGPNGKANGVSQDSAPLTPALSQGERASLADDPASPPSPSGRGAGGEGYSGEGYSGEGSPRLDLDEVYTGSRLLLLGGTGFLGKIFWVLLLHRFPGIATIFLMVRSSKEKTSEERFTEILGSDAMRPLRDKYGESFEAFVRSRVVPIDGEMSRPLCGVDAALVTELAGTLDAVVNVAGVVDFNPPLDESIEANAFGARNLIALARALGETPIFHTSTTMVVGDRLGAILEEDPMVHPFPRSDELGRDIWDPEREIDECLELCSQARRRSEDGFRQSGFAEQAKKALAARGEPSEGPAFEAELAKVKRKFMNAQLALAGQDRAKHWGWPNIYTYTKSIGEQIIARSGLPFTIARPASCESTHHFPFKGYNEGIGTSAPFIFLAMKGHVQFPASDDVLIEFIPSDYVCVGMALSLAELLEGKQKPVYQYAVGEVNPCSAARFAELMGIYKRKSYLKSSKGNPLWNFLQAHIEPVAVTTQRLDRIGPKAIAEASRRVASAMGSVEPLQPAARALRAFAAQEQKIGEMLDLFAPFTTIQKGPFSCANTRAAYARLSEADRARLPWEPEKLDWPDYWMTAHMPAIERRVIPEIEKRMRKELAPLASHETLVTLLEQMAERHGVAVALSHLEDAGLTRVSYRDLHLNASRVGERLRRHGVSHGDRIALVAHNHPDWAAAYFGVLFAGATVVPVDPGCSPDAFTRILVDSKARAALCDTRVKERFADRLAGVTVLDLHEATLMGDDGQADELAVLPVRVAPHDIASLLYTSGTTAAPKGVMLTHANFTSLIAGLAPLFPLKPGDRVLSVLPLHHTFEFTCGLLLPLSRGARVVYVGDVTSERLAKGLELGRVTAMVGVPALWQLLERRILSQVKSKGPLAETAFHLGTELNRLLGAKFGVDVGRALFGAVHESLGGRVKYLISGGAALPHGTHKLFAGLGLPLIEGYGLTEAAPVLTVTRGKSRAGQVGKAVPGVEVKVVERNDEGVGEVVARGPNVMAGYTRAEDTRAAIDAEGWLHTGDLGKLDPQGRLSIVGRLKDVIVTATGENVHPDDLEREIGEVEHIAELAVVGVEARGAERVACLAVPVDAQDIDRATRNERAMGALRAALGKLPFGKSPAIVHLYEAPLPRTTTRKVKRIEVREILERMIRASATPSADGQTSGVRVAIGAVRARAPETLSAEVTLQEDLGFDSLALSELLVALEAQFGPVEPSALQACRTVGEVEALVGSRGESFPRRRLAVPDGVEHVALPPLVQEAGKRFIGKLQDAFYGHLMNARVYGRANIPHNRNTIVVANHSSHLDMGFVRHALGTYGEDIVSLAAQDYFFDKSPLRRAFFENLTNLRAIDRKGGLRASERQAAEIIAEGKTMLIFPEGTRSPDGDIHDFKPLLGHLSLTYGVDILPVHLSGTREAMPKGQRLPSSRDLVARIGPPLAVDDLRRLTQAMTPADAAREVSRLAQRAVAALRAGDVLDLAAKESSPSSTPGPNKYASKKHAFEEHPPKEHPPKEHPLVTLFAELELKFKPGKVERPISYYFTLGGDPLAKWTVKVDPKGCEIRPGKPDGASADCVLKTSPEIFARIVRDAYTPGPAEFLSGAVKSNDVELLLTFQRAFELG
jgi:long-chain acyl-CoA synthetase